MPVDLRYALIYHLLVTAVPYQLLVNPSTSILLPTHGSPVNHPRADLCSESPSANLPTNQYRYVSMALCPGYPQTHHAPASAYFSAAEGWRLHQAGY